MKRQYKVLDLFAGGGGFSTGFLMAQHPQAAFDIIKAVEINEDACKTLELHLGHDRVVCGDLTKPEVKERLIQECIEKQVDIIIGGPPCQTFSLAGPARSGSKEMREALKNDDRNTLYKHFLDIVKKVKPHYVVFENVEGILSKKVEIGSELSVEERSAIELVCEDLEDIGYSSALQEDPSERYLLLNSAHYGVPQQRKRVIIIANRHGYLNPSPQKTHGDGPGLMPFVTIRDTIQHVPVVLPKIYHNKMKQLKNMHIVVENLHESLRLFIKTLNSIAKEFDDSFGEKIEDFNELLRFTNRFYEGCKGSQENPEQVLHDFIKGYNSRLRTLSESDNIKSKSTLHSSRAHNLRDIVIFCKMMPGSNSSQFMSPQMDAYDEFLDQLYPYAKNKHRDTYVKHAWTKPSNTILSHMEKDGLKFIHPVQPRSFTPYEAALLQSFPEDYEFCGKRNSQYRQIGNAVPPKMAAKIGEALLNVLFSHVHTKETASTG